MKLFTKKSELKDHINETVKDGDGVIELQSLLYVDSKRANHIRRLAAVICYSLP